MAINFNSLLAGGAVGWHTGNGTITYSFLGSILPTYYPQIDTDWDFTDDSYDIYTLHPNTYTLPLSTTDFSLSANERILAELAVQAWNDVAKVHLVAASVAPSGPTSGVPVTGNGTLVGGLGGAGGFGETQLPRNDDGSTSVDISAVFEDGLNFFGRNVSSVFVNTNGNITFDYALSGYTPQQISGGSVAMIAPFWADVDTRNTDGTAPHSQPISVDIDTTRDVVTFTWADVGYYNQHGEHLNSFQLQLYDRGNGDFDIVFRYDEITWTTGTASGGDENGLGGNVAHAGFTAGNGTDFYELAASGNQSAILNLENTKGNTDKNGLWVFQVRNGEVGTGDITFGSGNFGRDVYGFVSEFPGTLGTPSTHGDVWLNEGRADQASASYGNTGWQTYLHELGHALGLTHPNNDPDNHAGDPTNNNQYTVMSYVPHPGVASLPASQQAWPITPMLYDIQAMQQLYGPNLTTRTTNTNYLGAGGKYQLDNGGILHGTSYVGILTIWDAGGTDTVDASVQTSAVKINLNPGKFSTIGTVANNVAMAYAVTVGGTVVNYIENATGGSAGDTLTGNAANNKLNGRGGLDTMSGGAGDDTLIGGAGKDSLDGGAKSDTADYSEKTASQAITVTLNGTSAVSVKVGTATEDTIKNIENLTGGAGGDKLSGDTHANTFKGNDGNDTLKGGGGKDTLDGGANSDTADYSDKSQKVEVALNKSTSVSVKVNGSVEDSIKNIENLVGGSAGDKLTGDSLANRLNGGLGKDILDGGGGSDRFVFKTALGSSNVDTIVKFEHDSDRIELDNAVFKALSGTSLASAAFYAANGATKGHDANDRIVYNKTDGKLYYDADGNKSGGVGAIHFATLTNHPSTLDQGDFVIV